MCRAKEKKIAQITHNIVHHKKMAGDNNDRFFEDSGSSDKEEEFVDEDSKMDEAADSKEDGEAQQFSTSTQSTHKSKATPSKSKKDKYSEANVKARTNADGSVIPVTKPKLLPNGKYQRPKGRGRNGCSWDEDRGKFYLFKYYCFVVRVRE